MLTYM